jgi:N-acetylmuramoyl-L-alanine amidase
MMKEYKIIEAYLDYNSFSRSGKKMKGIKGIVIHWVANPKSTAMANRNYFNNLKNQTKTYASSHEIIGLDGEVVICIPSNEVAYHVGANKYTTRIEQMKIGNPNYYFYGIECCHPDWGGKFNDKTYNTLINRVADLLIEFDLKPSKDTIWRHYDVTLKDCPHYYVKNPKEWDKLIVDVTQKYNEKIEVLFMKELKEWQKEMGTKAITSLANKKIVNNPEEWLKSLGENTPQWLFWSIVDRITK